MSRLKFTTYYDRLQLHFENMNEADYNTNTLNMTMLFLDVINVF